MIKMFAKNTRANQENYNQKRKTANRICKNKKKEWLDHKTRKLCMQINIKMLRSFTEI